MTQVTMKYDTNKILEMQDQLSLAFLSNSSTSECTLELLYLTAETFVQMINNVRNIFYLSAL